MKNDLMRKTSRAIVKYRYIVFLLFAAMTAYAGLSLGRVKVNSDLTFFLSEETETRRGLTVMENEFSTYATANLMISNVTVEKAGEIRETLRSVAHVADVAFDDTEAHFKDDAALFSISFDAAGDDPEVEKAMAEILRISEPYERAVSTTVGQDFSKQIAGEMAGVIALAAAVILVVLLITSRSWFEVVIFGVVFVVAGLLNMGTNHWLGEISSITNSVAVILQLALAIDYAIIFAHRYQDEAKIRSDEREALVEALSRSIVEISSSSLTTISGLAALTLMQFRLGRDLGIVLAKGILCSMLTVFLLMPGLTLLFKRPLKALGHRTLLPDVRKWGRILMKTKYCFVLLFIVLLPFAVYCSYHVKFAFSDSSIDEIVYSERRAAARKIDETFNPDTMVAVLVPKGNYEYEKAVLRETGALPEIKNAIGLANVEFAPGKLLTDLYTPEMIVGLIPIGEDQANLLFKAYALEHGHPEIALGDVSGYQVPLVDLAVYLMQKIDEGAVTLNRSQEDLMNTLRGELERGVKQLSGENYDRLVLSAGVPAEGEESIALVERIRAIGERYYGAGKVLVVGNITSARDLRDSYQSDSVLISILTIVFVFLILLFTFRSPVAAAVLVFVIQGSIWINFSFPFLRHSSPSFVTNMIVSAIQMGATIDYAIVLMSRYRVRRKTEEKKAAMIAAVGESFPTIVTSGTIMTVAGLLIAFRITDVYVGHIGLAVGRGAFISMVLVLTVLPQMIVLFDRVIEKTTFRPAAGRNDTEVPDLSDKTIPQRETD